jgi:hypothetical protein
MYYDHYMSDQTHMLSSVTCLVFHGNLLKHELF